MIEKIQINDHELSGYADEIETIIIKKIRNALSYFEISHHLEFILLKY